MWYTVNGLAQGHFVTLSPRERKKIQVNPITWIVKTYSLELPRWMDG